MAQYTKSAETGTFPRTAAFPAARLAMAFVAIVAILAVAITAYAFSQPSEPIVRQSAATSDIVDGWLPGVTAANAERRLAEANALQDGWSSALRVAEPELVDGWASGLLKPEPELVDGWAARYLVDD